MKCQYEIYLILYLYKVVVKIDFFCCKSFCIAGFLCSFSFTLVMVIFKFYGYGLSCGCR